MIDGPRFWSHVSPLDDSCDACWIWVGSLTDDGRYGRYWLGHREEIRAHWAAWEIQHGRSVPRGYQLKQQCATPQCVRHWKLAGKARRITKDLIPKILASILGPRPLARKLGVSEGCVRHYRRKAVPPTRSTIVAGEPIA